VMDCTAYLGQYMWQIVDNDGKREGLSPERLAAIARFEGRYPTIGQGRNEAVRQSLARAFNRWAEIEPDTEPIGPESLLWNQYVSWLQRYISTYSINENSELIADESWPGAPERRSVLKDGKLNFNYNELIAEAFQDVESNGDSAWPTSKAIHAVLVQQYYRGDLGEIAQ
jgi:hypothetical protein